MHRPDAACARTRQSYAGRLLGSVAHQSMPLPDRVRGGARPIDPGVTIGPVHLRTADISRVRAFYVDVLGFDVVLEARGVPGWGTTGDILYLRAYYTH
jgi:hypothetical protein